MFWVLRPFEDHESFSKVEKEASSEASGTVERLTVFMLQCNAQLTTQHRIIKQAIEQFHAGHSF